MSYCDVHYKQACDRSEYEQAVIRAAQAYVTAHSEPQRTNEPLIRTNRALHDAVRALADEERPKSTMSG
jgi:hypothetical protein